MRRNREFVVLDDDPLWYKRAVLYELNVRAFRDSNADGVGDFAGLIDKLDYLQDLGITAVWLLPFYPSPLRDDGYDISDYNDVNPAYGTIRDFQAFLHAAHGRGMRVITEMVLNHTSDQHAWFQRSRSARPGSPRREFYVWSDSPDKYSGARIIFKDFVNSNWTWDPVAKAYYFHRFYPHQPDLNYGNPLIRRAMLEVVDFWLDMGVDGIRLDAIPYLFEREGTNCENLPETHDFLKELRSHIDARYTNRMLLAEANQWPEDAAAYFGMGDECHMAFHFPLMPRLFMAIRMEDRFPILDILGQTPPIPESCQWALFLRNHDELTLEMVTDEERDYMYRVYARDPQTRVNLGIRRRLTPLLDNDRKKIELMYALLFSLPGTPVIYYGDEIGMGDNVYLGDRNGVRTPMQWSPDRNAGFSGANPQRLYAPLIIDPEHHYESVNVETQQKNPHSLLWWIKRLIALRKKYEAFGMGSLEMINHDNHKVISFVRQSGDERILMVANLSRFIQGVTLNLEQFKGAVPTEIFGGSELPAIGEHPYFLTLGPHGFYWLALEPSARAVAALTSEAGAIEMPILRVESHADVFKPQYRSRICRLLPDFLRSRRWFPTPSLRIQSVEIVETLLVPGAQSRILLVRVERGGREPELYALALSAATGEKADRILAEHSEAVFARLRAKDESEGVLYGVLWDPEFCGALFDVLINRRRLKGNAGELVVLHTPALRRLLVQPAYEPRPTSQQEGPSGNSTIVFGNRFILKLLRRLETGTHPGWEIGKHLTERMPAGHIALTAAALEYRPVRGEPMMIALLHGFVHGQTDAWNYTIDCLSRFFERALVSNDGPPAAEDRFRRLEKDIPDSTREVIGTYLETARLLGRRTAELHHALASEKKDPEFSPEPFSEVQRLGLYHSWLDRTGRAMAAIEEKWNDIPDESRGPARAVLDRKDEIQQRFRSVRDTGITALRIRCHGDYHLRKVLYTGKDFSIIGFEGEGDRSLSERRLKRLALTDVATMLASFHDAAHSALAGEAPGILSSGQLGTWADFWSDWVGTAFLQDYLAASGQAPFLPPGREETMLLLDALLLDAALHKVAICLRDQAARIGAPLHRILDLLVSHTTSEKISDHVVDTDDTPA